MFINTEFWFRLSVQYKNLSSTQGFGSFQTGCCSKRKENWWKEKKNPLDYNSTIHYKYSQHYKPNIDKTNFTLENSLPCGPPYRRLARCYRRQQISPHFQAADTQNQFFIVVMRWRGEACCLCYRLNTQDAVRTAAECVDTAVTSLRPVL